MIPNHIQIAAFSFPYVANIAKASLDAANIPATIADEHTINMDWLMSDALGGVRLFVPLEYETEARALIEQDYSYLVEQEFAELPEQKKTCPVCGGTELQAFTLGKKPAFIVLLLLGFPLFFYKRRIKCQNCGDITVDTKDSG